MVYYATGKVKAIWFSLLCGSLACVQAIGVEASKEGLEERIRKHKARRKGKLLGADGVVLGSAALHTANKAGTKGAKQVRVSTKRRLMYVFISYLILTYSIMELCALSFLWEKRAYEKRMQQYIATRKKRAKPAELSKLFEDSQSKQDITRRQLKVQKSYEDVTRGLFLAPLTVPYYLFVGFPGV